MAIAGAYGDAGLNLPDDAKRLYAAITRGEWELVDEIRTGDERVWAELLRWGFVDCTDPARPVALDPRPAIQRMVLAEIEEAQHRLDQMARMPDLVNSMVRDYQSVSLRTVGTGSSEYLSEQALVNARIKDVLGRARREILAAQPGGPRTQELFNIAAERDTAALDRGVDLRTIYRDTVRDHPVTAQYAQTMSARTGGRPAQYRTMVGDFERMIIVDREVAFLSDHVVAGSPPHSAWMVTDPAVVAVLARVHEATWQRAQPWTGELRTPGGRDGAGAVVGPDGVRTSRQQRGIMRYLCTGDSQAAIARKVDVSKRKLEEEIATLKSLWGVRTLNELIFQYALSPDRLVDDSDPAGDVTRGSAA